MKGIEFAEQTLFKPLDISNYEGLKKTVIYCITMDCF
jgi:hypothetical protein